MNKLIQGFIFIFLSVSSAAQSAEYFAWGEVGRGDVEFDDEYFFEGFDGDDTFSSANILGGYKFDSKVVVAAHVGMSGSESLFGWGDNYQLYEVGALLGYSFDIAEHFRIVPMVGVSRWELDREEGEFNNPGPEESREISGTDFYWKLNVEAPINDFIQLNLSYTRGQFEFGSVEAIRFGAKFAFQVGSK